MIFSTEGRVYNATKKVIDDELFIEVVVLEKSGRQLTRDHLPASEARRLAAELVLAVEG